MNAQSLENYTVEISQFDDHRKYIGLSQIHLPIDQILSNIRTGQKADHFERLKCYKGYQMERDLVWRIQKLYGSRISQRDIVAHNGMVQGHPDFWYDDIPGDVKSVLLDQYLPEDKLPRKVYWQLQGYMLYSGSMKAIAVYESRESGRLRHKWINRNEAICDEIQQKVESLISELSPVFA